MGRRRTQLLMTMIPSFDGSGRTGTTARPPEASWSGRQSAANGGWHSDGHRVGDFRRLLRGVQLRRRLSLRVSGSADDGGLHPPRGVAYRSRAVQPRFIEKSERRSGRLLARPDGAGEVEGCLVPRRAGGRGPTGGAEGDLRGARGGALGPG